MMRFPRIVIASVLMGVAVYFMAQYFGGAIGGKILADIALLLGVSAAGLALYGVLALALKAVSLRDMKSAFKKG